MIINSRIKQTNPMKLGIKLSLSLKDRKHPMPSGTFATRKK